MKTNLLISARILCILLFSFSITNAAKPQSYSLEGKLVRLFSSAGNNHFAAVSVADNGEQVVVRLSRELAPSAKWNLPSNTEWLQNDGFKDALVFVELRDAADTVTKIRGTLKWLDLETGAVHDLKQMVRNEKLSGWSHKSNRYLFGGRLFACSGGKVASERVSGAPYTVISDDERYSAQYMIRRGDYIEGSVTVEDLKNQDMLNVATFRMVDTMGLLMDFSSDSRYLYYRSGDSPALYDLKELRGLSIPDVKYKHPAFVGAYLAGDRYFVFHDYQGIVLVGRKSFEVEDVVPNPFGDAAIKILGAKGVELNGVIYESRSGVRIYTKAFTASAKGMEPKNSTLDLPVNTLSVDIEGKKVAAVYYDNGNLLLYEARLK